MKNTLLLLFASLFIVITSCKKDIDTQAQEEEKDEFIQEQSNSLSIKEIEKKIEAVYQYFHYQDPEGMFGSYHYYMRLYHFIGEYAGDNVSLSGTTSDPYFNIYTYNHNVDNGEVKLFYKASYKMIAYLNSIITNTGNENIPDSIAHQIGECHFLRGFVYANLVNAFGRPYQQSPETNLGVSLILDTVITDVPARATVAEVYNAIEADYLKAANLMQSRDYYYSNNLSQRNIRASKEVAWAALSRFYLYKGSGEGDIFEQKAAIYADSVITSGTYNLIKDSANYANYARRYPENNIETIFAIRQTESVGWAAIGSMYYAADGNGWGEMYASEPYRNLLDQNPSDWRRGFIHPQYKYGTNEIKTRNGFPKYYISKCSFQDDILLMYSPVIFRLAEMYLNRAEANAKLGNIGEALEDVNIIRTRVNIPNWQASQFSSNTQLLDSILQERQLELAFEAHRKFDIFRNNKTLDRNYPGSHETIGAPLSIEPNHLRVVLYLPEEEINANPNLIQNP